jgi:transferase family hexapeptide repeat protein
MFSQRAIAQVVARLLRPLLCLFFERRYLTGRFFDDGMGGYVWAVRAIWLRNVLRMAPPRPWPMSVQCTVSAPGNLTFHPDDLNNFQSPGTYFQNPDAHITIGRGTYIAPNVGIITANHARGDLERHETARDVVLGERCWIGMNAVILPGVILGPDTVVAAGAVVTRSYPDGGATLAGVPATPLRDRPLA